MLDSLMPKNKSTLNGRVGKNLRFIRKAFQMSQEDVASVLNVTPQQIYKYETGKNNITCANLAKLSKLFGCNMDFFLSSRLEDGQKNEDVLQVSEKSKAPVIKKKTKNSETIEMLKAYLKLNKEDKKKIRETIKALLEK